MRKLIIKRLFIVAGISLFVCIGIILACNGVVINNAQGQTYDNVSEIPSRKIGLLLGTSPITPQGEHNYYFDNRIYATVELYKQGKIKQIIASGGDYSAQNGCNELIAMRDSLVAHGVPDSVITLDYKGLRTINSIVNVKTDYDLDSLIIISQKYHNERAIWLAEHYGLHAIAYNATTPDITTKKIKNTLREFLARVKMFLDILTQAQSDNTATPKK